MPEHSGYLTRIRIPNLDGLRGLAILLVLAHHVPTAATGWVAQFQHNGRYGVSLFFVISGYIVMTLMLREVRRSGSVDVRRFLWRRVLRLWPLYYLILLAEFLLVFAAQIYSPQNQALFADKLACYVLYCSNWLETSGEGPFFVAWSLAVEEQFYLLLSLLLILRPGPLVAIFGGMLALKVALVHGYPEADLAELPWRVVLSYSEAILMGVLMAYFLDRPQTFRWYSRLALSPLVPGILLATFGAFLLFGELDDTSGGSALAFYLICTLLVGACAVNKRLPLVGGKPLSWMGLLSYGVYLMHMPVLSAAKKISTEPVAVMVLTLAVVLPLAWLSFTFFEEPIRRLGVRRTRPGPGRSRKTDISPTARPTLMAAVNRAFR
ncbi:MAG: acyltransferase [Gammaproteobacteria bacterium]|nr:MAG: acyltransferase [Gammaproteobacteria bacterium]